MNGIETIAARVGCSLVKVADNGFWFEGSLGSCKRLAAALGLDATRPDGCETAIALRWALDGTFGGEIVSLPGIGTFALIHAPA
jgi:hypothetical protein